METSNNTVTTVINKPALPTSKSIEFVIGNKKYTTSSVTNKPHDEGKIIEGEGTTLEASLKSLQVGATPKRVLYLYFK